MYAHKYKKKIWISINHTYIRVISIMIDERNKRFIIIWIKTPFCLRRWKKIYEGTEKKKERCKILLRRHKNWIQVHFVTIKGFSIYYGIHAKYIFLYGWKGCYICAITDRTQIISLKSISPYVHNVT